MRSRNRLWSIASGASAFLMLALVACAPTDVKTTDTYRGARLAKPSAVVVDDFTVPPDSVELNRGLLARAARSVAGTGAADQREVASTVTDAVAQELVKELRAAGLPATRAADAPVTAAAARVIINGDLLSIDEGNRMRRTLIGLGAGRSQVAANATVTYDAPDAGPRTILAFQADSKSGRKPGAAETMGVGAAAGRLAESAAVSAGTDVVSETMGATVEADSRRMAKAIAEKIIAFAVTEGWIAAP